MAELADIRDAALNLPGVVEDTEREHGPAYSVGGKTFVFFREPRPDAVDPDTGRRMDDVIVFWVPSDDTKLALVAAGPWFTTSHWNGYRAVLLRARDLGRVGRDELVEVITEGWLARAPKRLVQEFLESR